MERKPRAMATADSPAGAVALDMTAQWIPTARTYFGLVTKPHAVREAVSIEAAERMADTNKQDMAEAPEQLLVAAEWLSALMRTPHAAQERTEHPQTDAVTGGEI